MAQKPTYEQLEQRIKELEASEKKQGKREQELDRLFNLSVDMLCVADMDGNFKIINEAFEKTMGYSKEVIYRHTYFYFLHPDDIASTKSAADQLSRGEPVTYFENRYLCKDGSYKWLAWTSMPVAEENVTYAVARDVTEHKQAEEALRKAHDELEHRVRERTADLMASNERLKKEIDERIEAEKALQDAKNILETIINNIPNQIFWKSRELVYLGCNQPFADVTGMGAPNNVIGKTDFEFHRDNAHAESYRQWDKKIMDSDEAVIDLEESFHTTEGVEGTVLTSKVPLHNEKGEVFGLLGICTDITERKKMEEGIKEARDFLEKVIESSRDGIIISDKKGYVMAVNSAAERIYGTSRKDMIGNHIAAYAPDDEKSMDEIRIRTQELFEKGFAFYESTRKTKDGTTINLEATLSMIRDEDDNFTAGVAVIRDVTKRKQLEDEKGKLRAQLTRAEKMETIGTLAGGVAHDLNNILGAIVGYPDLMLDDIPSNSSLRKSVLAIKDSGERAASIVQDLLTLARRGIAITEVSNLNSIITRYLGSREYLKLKEFHPGAQVETNLEPDLLNIFGSPVHLSKMVMNMVSNAAEAMPGGGTITISTENRYLDTPIKGYDRVEDGDYIVLAVSDNGIGISQVDLGRIFEPFYTKKVMGRSGTGLGMAVVWGTVKDHKGYIDVESEEGIGTTFRLYFPVTRKDMMTKKGPVPVEKFTGNGEKILIVDDVETQREIASTFLKKLKYHTQTVSSGEEAVEYMKSNSADLLVLDMIMDPGIDGYETYKQILEINPNQKAIIASGFSETDRVKEAQKSGAGAYIKKPYTLEKLGMAVKEELKRNTEE